MFIFFFYLYLSFFLSGSLLTVLFFVSICLTGDFLVFEDVVLFSFTLFKLNLVYLKKCLFSFYFFFNHELYSAIWFNNTDTLLCSETFFFNSTFSSARFLIFVRYSILYPIIFIYFCKFRKSFSLFIGLQFIGFLLYSYVLYLFLNVYVRVPNVFFFKQALLANSRIPNCYFPGIFWDVPSVDRTCIFCYADNPEVTFKLVNDAFFYYSLAFPDCGQILCDPFPRYSRVVEIKQKVLELLFSQCPNYADDYLQDSVKYLRKNFKNLFNLRLYYP